MQHLESRSTASVCHRDFLRMRGGRACHLSSKNLAQATGRVADFPAAGAIKSFETQRDKALARRLNRSQKDRQPPCHTLVRSERPIAERPRKRVDVFGRERVF